MIKELNLRIETQVSYIRGNYEPTVTTRLVLGEGTLVFETTRDFGRDGWSHAEERCIDDMQQRFVEALGRLMRGESDDELCYVVVGSDYGESSPIRMAYSVSGQWTRTADRAKRMTLADAQAFVEKYSNNEVRHIRDLAELLPKNGDG